MGFLSVIGMAHKWIAERTAAGDAAIDATAGGGVDTFELAKLVGPKGTVYAFDIQQEALDRTSRRLSALEAAPDVRLILGDHSRMADFVDARLKGKIAAVMFNLGYLPGGDQKVITRPATTIPALDAALALLRPGGILTSVLYPGHPGGGDEASSVEAWASSLPVSAGQAVVYRQLQRKEAPYLIAILKK